jgi:hypothetical protein
VTLLAIFTVASVLQYHQDESSLRNFLALLAPASALLRFPCAQLVIDCLDPLLDDMESEDEAELNAAEKEVMEAYEHRASG